MSSGIGTCLSKTEAAEILAGNKDARGSDRVRLLFQAGQYYFQDGEANAGLRIV